MVAMARNGTPDKRMKRRNEKEKGANTRQIRQEEQTKRAEKK
jgi:hypothetical protein